MKLFQLSWAWYEEHSFYLFLHPDKTKEQFEEDCKLMMRKYAVDTFMKEHPVWASMPDIVEAAAEHLHELGYIKAEPETYSIWDGYIIAEDDDEKIKEVLGKELFELACNHNNKVENII